MSERTQALAGMVTGGILDEAVKTGYAVKDDTAEAVQQASQEPAEAPAVPVEPLDPVDEIVESLKQQGEAETVDISAEVEPADDDAEFELPDFEAEAEQELLNEEIAASGEEGYEDEGEWVEESPGDSEARKRAIVAEKKAAFYENLTAKRERKKWEAEADKHFPLWRARGEIKVNSRRGFLKAAKEADAAVTPFVSQATKTRLEQLDAERAQLKDEAKAEAQAAWGKPTVATQMPANTGRDFEAEYRKAGRDGDLAARIRIKREWRAAEGGEQ